MSLKKTASSAGGRVMDLSETEKRMKSFQQHHRFAIVSHTLYPQKQTLAVTNHVEVSSDSSSSSSDDESDQEVASELTEEQFDIIMDTLSAQPQLLNIDKDAIDMSPVMDNVPITIIDIDFRTQLFRH
mmetsp:Transcript_50529/g.60947  ORF Transcript_50529/g.60947 Transcript_50529/m.60947 type:complete len:128 (+) Transcript_50529:185-568(+)